MVEEAASGGDIQTESGQREQCESRPQTVHTERFVSRLCGVCRRFVRGGEVTACFIDMMGVYVYGGVEDAYREREEGEYVCGGCTDRGGGGQESAAAI